MATLLLTAAGAAVGGSFGGTILGLSGAVIGKAIGGTVGALIDQKVLGSGAEPVEVGRIESLRLQGSTEGTPIPRVFGRMRLAGHLIWSTRYRETVRTSGGSGKGMAGGGAEVREFSYSVSIALALCEGIVAGLGRVWADGKPFALERAVYRLHKGSEGQSPDPLIEATEGVGLAPSYRGTAYVVFEDLDLSEFGNRIPVFNFEVFRQPDVPETVVPDAKWRLSSLVRGVCLIPGTGEYVLAPEPVSYRLRKAVGRVANMNGTTGETDLVASMQMLESTLPACDAVSLVVSWFGDDLRCDRCRIEPAVEQKLYDSPQMPWSVSGVTRSAAKVVGLRDGRPAFGGTPADASVVAAIRRLKADGKRVVYYPFILMDISPGNGLNDPWGGSAEQPAYPWRGRITLSVAPGRVGSPDKTTAAGAEVTAFFGGAQASDFSVAGDTVSYGGPDDWGYRRFILHQAQLCAAAGGVEAFLIGSELRSLTQIRDGAASYPVVAALRALAADVRAILGPSCRISYAADWSEYFGHNPADGSGDLYFHLDPLWADSNIDFVGIDNYMPLSDWRSTPGHADEAAGSIYNLDYLRANVAGGEGYDWYYASSADRDGQVRRPITDGAFGEAWVFRYKDLRNWWSRPHHDRPGGQRSQTPSPWVPESKPIWFTEFGCPAVDKGTNQPNVFSDPKSSESALPYYSNGSRDDFLQTQYLRAQFSYWSMAANNPVSGIYGGPMVDLANAYVWAWDARPWPAFPMRTDVWSDGAQFDIGHWIGGRLGSAGLAEVVAELCLGAGESEIDVNGLWGALAGYTIQQSETARQSIQPLMLGFGFDVADRDGRLAFRMRESGAIADLSAQVPAISGDSGAPESAEQRRAPDVETPDAVRVRFIESEADYQAAAVAALQPGTTGGRVEQAQVPVAMSAGIAQQVADRWLAEIRAGRDETRIALPPSLLRIEPGDLVRFASARRDAVFRVESIEDRGARIATARRIEKEVYRAEPSRPRPAAAAGRTEPWGVEALVVDLPVLRTRDDPLSPWLIAAADPWPGRIACFASRSGSSFRLIDTRSVSSVIGETVDVIPPSRPWLFSRGAGVRILVSGGGLASRVELDVLNGANLAGVRSAGSTEFELIQFRSATLVAPDTYEIAGLIRGQGGTEHLAGLPVPAGSEIVFLSETDRQLPLQASEPGLETQFRIGPASLPYTNPRYLRLTHSGTGVGLRPYSPARLRARRLVSGDVEIVWVRRTRVGGDSWAGREVPLSETSEEYEVTIISGSQIVRRASVARSSFLYLSADQATDAVGATFACEVSQVSSEFGPGPAARIDFNG